MGIFGIVALSFLGLILLIVLLVLFVPFSLYVIYANNLLEVKVGFMGIKYTLINAEEDKKKKKKKKKDKNKKPKKKKKTKPDNVEKKIKRKLGLTDIESIKDIVTEYLPKLLNCLVINWVKIVWYVTGDDAAKTAINYGAASAAISGIFVIADRFARLRHASADIYPDFDKKGSGFSLDLKISATSARSIIFAIKLILVLYKKKII